MTDRERYRTMIDILTMLAQEARPRYVSECHRLYHELERLRRDWRESFPDTVGDEK
jgi:hypothetical protein